MSAPPTPTASAARRWVYRPDAPAAPSAGSGPRFALIIDQFEEIISTHPERWAERADFFRQLDAALRADPNLWIVLTLREDYVASLDPYAALVTNKLQARYRMERMDVDAALEAVRKPAELGGRPFAPGVAEALVDDLRQIRMAGQVGAVPGQYVEPVQLQVVCYQLWKRLQEERNLVSVRNQVSPDAITQEDLAAAGDVDKALEQFYAATLAAVTADPAVAAAGVSERSLRTWFDKELITPSGIRSIVLRNEGRGRTGSLPNAAVDALSQRFLLRTELRGGGAWVELVHDRFVEPIRASNEAWFAEHLSTLQRAAALWQDSGRAAGLLLADAALDDAVAWASTHALLEYEQEFLDASLQLRTAAERERKQRQRISMLAIAASIGLIVAIMALIFAGIRTQDVEAEEQRSRVRQLAYESSLNADKYPQQAILLAVEAMKIARTNDQSARADAEQVLRDSLVGIGGQILTGHSGWIDDVEFGPAANLLVTAGYDRKVLLWRLTESGVAQEPTVLQTLNEDEGVDHVLFTDDKHWLVIGHGLGPISIWDISSGVPLTTPINVATEIDYFPFAAAVSPDSRWLAVARSEPNGILLWDLKSDNISESMDEIQNGVPITQSSDAGYFDSQVASLSFSSNGRWLVSSNYSGIVYLNDLAKSDVTTATQEIKLGTFAVSPKGEWLVGQRKDGGIISFGFGSNNPKDLSPVMDLDDQRIETFRFSDDGQWLAGATQDGSIHVWNVDETGVVTQSSRTLIEGDIARYQLEFSPDNKWLAADDFSGNTRLWNVSPAADAWQQYELEYSGQGQTAVFSPDGSWLGVAADNSVFLWDLQQITNRTSPIQLRGFDTKELSGVEFSPDSNWLVASAGYRFMPARYDDTVRLWNLRQRDFSTESEILQAHATAVNKAVFDPNQQRLFTGGYWPDSTVRVLDAESLTSDSVPQTLAELEGNVDVLVLSPDSRWLVAYGSENSEFYAGQPAPLRLWEISPGELDSQEPIILDEDAVNISGAVFSDDGNWLLTLGATPVLWNLANGARPAKAVNFPENEGPVWSAAFSHDGRWLITGGSSDSTVKANVWDLAAGNLDEASYLLGNQLRRDTGAISVSPDNKWVVAGEGYQHGCDYCTVSAWKLSATGPDPGSEVRLGEHKGPIREILFTSDSKAAITASEDGTVRIWNLDHPDGSNHPIVLNAARDPVNSIALSADDRTLVAGNGDGSIRVWDLTEQDPNQSAITLNSRYEGDYPGRLPFDDLMRGSGAVEVFITSVNNMMISANADGTIRTWNLRSTDLIESACSVVGRNLTQEEWDQYFPDEAYRLTCRNLAGDALPIVDEGQRLAREGKIKEAIAEFEAALLLDPSLPLSPSQEAVQLGAPVLIEQVRSLVSAGQIDKALDHLNEVQALADDLDLLSLRFSICTLQNIAEVAEPISALCSDLISIAPTVVPNHPVTGSISSQFADPWKLEIAASSSVTITLTAREINGLDPYLTLYDAGFNVITETDDIESGAILDSALYGVALADPGIYWITAGRCCPNDDQGRVGQYALEVSIKEDEESSSKTP